jgi:ribonuclease BN (tRNA processing enzyme)
MEITFLGTCSGTEPMPNRKHTSFVVQHRGGIYWFDAGEGCSYTAYLAGIDLFSTQSIFISHVHIDHVGGLANLVWTMHKLQGRNKDSSRSLAGRTIPVFIPNLNVWQGVLQVAGGPADFCPEFTLDANPYLDGIIYEKNGLKVTALHNRHLGEPDDGKPWQSFSYRIEAEGRVLVSSGDAADVREMEPLLEGCDLFIMETGHHNVEDVCAYLRGTADIGKLGFFHHGRAILADGDGELEKARDILGDKVFIADDGMTVEV